jgi:hypothetical protein
MDSPPDDRPNPIFELDGRWYFWDETWTKYLGPFPTESHAKIGIECYEKYLAYGEIDSFLVGTSWHSGEELS